MKKSLKMKFITLGLFLFLFLLQQTIVKANQIFSEDWELGDLNTTLWNDVGSTTGYVPKVVNNSITPPHMGNYSLMAYTNVTGYQNSRIYRDLETLEYANFNFWIKPERLVSNLYGSVTVAMITNSELFGTGKHLFIFNIRKTSSSDPMYQWVLGYYNTSLGSMTYIYSQMTNITNDWYEIEMSGQIGDKIGNVSLRINGTLIGSAINITNNDIVQAIDNIVVGSESGEPITIYYDDLEFEGNPFTPPPNRIISGRVLGYYDTPIPDAIIQVGNYFNRTDSNGYFNLFAPAGYYNLYVYKVGYNTSSTGINTVLEDATNMNINLVAADTAGKFWEIRSVVVFPYWFSYSSTTYDNLLDEIRSKYGDMINTIETRFYFEQNSSNMPIFYDQNGGNTWNQLATAIDKAHAKKFKFILGHVMRYENHTTGGINPSNWTEWWEAYKNLTVTGAIFAEQHGVEMLHIGWELGIDDPRFENGTFGNYWNDTISEIRNVYNGSIAYEPNWWYTYEGGPSLVGFNDQLNNNWYENLDYIALSTYPSLTDKLSPTLEELIGGWKNNTVYEIQSYTDTYRQLANKFNKKIIINTGYSSSDGVNNRPWSTVGQADHIEQAMIWQSFFESWKNEDFILGVDMEHYDRSYSETDRTASFRGKIADSIINEEISLTKNNMTKIALEYNDNLKANNKSYINSTTNLIAGINFNEASKQFKFVISGNETGIVEIYSPYGEPYFIRNATEISYDGVTKILRLEVVFP